MDKPTEIRLAKAAYNWLKVSPILTLGTLLFIASTRIGDTICDNSFLACSYDARTYISFTIGVILSALWHLILLQYVNNKDSEFVRRHGQKALTQAGIRTGVALICTGLDWSLGAGGGITCLAIIILLIIWAINISQSKRWVEEDLELSSELEDESNTLQPAADSNDAIELENIAMNESDPRTPEETLNEIYKNLQSEDDVAILQAISSLKDLNYSSGAIRRELEWLAVKSENKDIRNDALAALNSTGNRAVQKRVNANKLERSLRFTLLNEISEWEKSDLLDKQNADVIRRRYDYDITTAAAQPQPVAAPVQPAIVTPSTPPTTPPTPPEPRPSLLQTLTSEASIKIYLYLGAFFVIAAAAILGTVVPELRLPILIIGTLIFGGLAIAIKKRLPQPSFALFIVFSFLLPITANSIEETLREAFNLSATISDGYWAIVFLVMTAIWIGSTWLYESRLFSITAFGSLILSLLRIGDMLEAETVIYTLLIGFATLVGLAGTWLLKKWKDEKFALPLFLSAQLLQAINLLVSFTTFGIDTFEPSSENLWNLVTVATWGLATAFYVTSNWLYSFFAFPWLAAATLVPMPWFIATAFDLESLGSSIVLLIWGALLAVASEVLRRFERVQKYSLPILLASMPSLALAIFTGFVHETWLGLVTAFGAALLFALLHILQTRWWLWTLALVNAIIAYFAFFQLDFIQKLDLFLGYELVGITILFLLPDLLLKKDWKENLQWRLPLRIFGAAFLFVASLVLLPQDESGHIAISYIILALFCVVYALAYRKSYLGYLPAAYLPLAIVYALDAFNIDAWLPALSALAVIYYLAGIAIRKNEPWGNMLRNSGLALGTLLSFTALILTKETGGWYALGMGLLFIAEMYLSRDGWFEIGAPILFTLGIFLILRDFDVDHTSYHLLAYSLVWLLADLFAHLTFTNPRPLSIIVRVVGAMLTLINYGDLLAENDALIPTIGFGVYALLFLTISLLYRQPNLLYTFTLTLPLFVTFLFRLFDVTQWIHPVIVVAMIYYAAGTFLRAMNRAKDWDLSLLYSGLGVGTFVAFAAPVLGGLDASIPVAVAATLWAFEAFAKRNAWLAFPANGLYLLAYFIILFELNVDEPQYFSVGTALFGLIQHYLLTRANSKSGAFIMGMFSQFVLLGTTYIEMINKNDLNYFFLLFLQSMIILVYGLVIRSRSLTFFPIGFVALGVVTVVYSALKDRAAIFVIGCTGILLLMLGVGAVLLRERIAKLGEKLSDWQA